MVDWKTRSKIYHMMTPDPGDDLSKETIIEEWDEEDIIQKAIEYWYIQTKELYYPAKSYAVATTFAILLALNFGGKAKDYLNDSELLPHDPYFKTYNQNPEIYDILLNEYSTYAMTRPDHHCENYKLTVDYFYKEMLLHEETRHLIPSK